MDLINHLLPFLDGAKVFIEDGKINGLHIKFGRSASHFFFEVSTETKIFGLRTE